MKLGLDGIGDRLPLATQFYFYLCVGKQPRGWREQNTEGGAARGMEKGYKKTKVRSRGHTLCQGSYKKLQPFFKDFSRTTY